MTATTAATATTRRPTDLELLSLVREGEHAHFGEIWNRYQGWAHHVARSTTARYDAEDIVQEAFAKVLTSLRNGNGPREGFAHYLRTAIRNVAATWGGRDSRATMVPFTPDTALGSYEFEVTDLGDLEQPFRQLPERWQQVLHLSCLQGLPMATVAETMGMTVGAATALAARARRGLRESLAATRDDYAVAA
ncbi:sigma-70 family RNA polymerase sigma factor [Leifsonia shinshuensis]|uniref:RNA polymerase sigma factor n=1 Tax=Leifsonia shinshuensis TaxID=150026 RepID=UPI0028550975|nr:sigma-70 family RNA polymerase sigma factor [Leifsonia shinshuensis]MDR6972529.1 RNA polymerase sigma-70 factor (ECF subfamily) [Leifsonia shinshuensis]